jgi:hypothetical protein
VINIRVVDNLYVIQGPKILLALMREQFIAALKRAKALKRGEAMAQRLKAAAQ